MIVAICCHIRPLNGAAVWCPGYQFARYPFWTIASLADCLLGSNSFQRSTPCPVHQCETGPVSPPYKWTPQCSSILVEVFALASTDPRCKGNLEIDFKTDLRFVSRL